MPDFVFLGLNSRVIALNKRDGQIMWSIPLGGILGDGFVTVHSDNQHVYAYVKGKVFCIDPLTGHVIWTNELKGYGYGIGSICLPGFGSAPEAVVYTKHEANESASSADNSAD